jgi:hypothetical protein
MDWRMVGELYVYRRVGEWVDGFVGGCINGWIN